MGTTSTCNTLSTPGDKSTIPHLEQLPTKRLRPIASVSTHPLISAAAAAYVLALLYLPRHLLSLLLSPLSLTTLLLLAALLHLGSSSSPHHQQEEKQNVFLTRCPPCAAAPAAVTKTPPSTIGSQQKSVLSLECHHFVDWARQWGPLEVIYEEYEGEVEEDDMDEDSPGSSGSPGRTRHSGSLGTYCYTDDDSGEDSESDSPAWDSQESFFFRWEVEDDGLIEIALEEDNLIEIDISACP